ASSEDVTATTVVATTTSASLPRRRDDTCSIVVLLPCGPYGTARQTTPGAPFADRENRVIRNLRRSGGDSRDFAEFEPERDALQQSPQAKQRPGRGNDGGVGGAGRTSRYAGQQPESGPRQAWAGNGHSESRKGGDLRRRAFADERISRLALVSS